MNSSQQQVQHPTEVSNAGAALSGLDPQSALAAVANTQPGKGSFINYEMLITDYWCAPGTQPHLQVPGVIGGGEVLEAHSAGHSLKLGELNV